MNTFKITFALILFCIVGANLALSQDKSSKNDKKAKQMLEIKANVLVLDEKGNPVNEIKVEDLKVFEDGIEQKITYFVKKEPVLNLGLVVDNSNSMRHLLSDAALAASTIVDNLRSIDEAVVVRFVSSKKIEVIQEWTSNKDELKETIDLMYIDAGQTAVLDAVYLTAEKILERAKKNNSNRYAIVLISDAEEIDSYYDFDEIKELFKGTDLQIFLLSYAEHAPKNKKKARIYSHLLPLKTGGTVYTLRKNYTKEELNAALKAIDNELQSQYIIGYTSTNQKKDGLPRKLTVRIADGVNGEKRQGFIREEFVVPKSKL